MSLEKPKTECGKVSNAPRQNKQFLPALKSRLLQYPDIKSVSGALSGMSTWSAMFVRPDETQNPELVRFNIVDLDYIKTLGIQLSQGRWFSSEYVSDESNAVVVNEAFVRKFNVKEPTERTLSEFFKFKGPGNIIGVVRDFHFDSLRQQIQPAFLNLGSDSVWKVYIQTETEDLNKTIDIIKREFAAGAPGYPFLFSFLDDEVAQQYENEKRWSLMITIVCIFAILISPVPGFSHWLSKRQHAGPRKSVFARCWVLRSPGLFFFWPENSCGSQVRRSCSRGLPPT